MTDKERLEALRQIVQKNKEILKQKPLIIQDPNFKGQNEDITRKTLSELASKNR